ncbi:MAG: PspC domain-containing protein [Firmicutes bacterium]|nr:PspC domain-containing protein [Bacillota bacterium]
MESKRLYRSRKERMIGGVAGGLADYFNDDVTVVRLLWIMAFFMGGGIAYLIAWIIIPEEPFVLNNNDNRERTEGQESPEDRERRWRRGGVLLIVLGIFFLLRALLPLPRFRDLIPFFLIILGIFILFGGFNRNG